jgi:hypothetical protein
VHLLLSLSFLFGAQLSAVDAPRSGPLVFLLCFGFALLLKGKVQFGFIYGLGMMGCGSIWLLLNLMSHDIDLATSTSILGYCLLPMVAVAYLSLIFKGIFLTILVIFSIALCTWRATSMFVNLFRSSPLPSPLRSIYFLLFECLPFIFCCLHAVHFVTLPLPAPTATPPPTRSTSSLTPSRCSTSPSQC